MGEEADEIFPGLDDATIYHKSGMVLDLFME